jgi:hypothetical protein
MAFNWKDFATGFLEQTNITIDEKADDAKERKERQETLARQNAALVEQRRQRARAAATLGNQARALGATDEQLAVALNSGMGGVQTFTQTLQNAANQRGVQSLSPDDISAIMDMPDLPPVDMSYEDMVQQVYGARPTTVPGPQSEPPMWASMLGLTADRDMQNRLATEQFSGGLTVQQINDMAASSEYSQIPGMEGAYVNYGEDTFFTNENAVDFRTSMREARQAVESSDAFGVFSRRILGDVDRGLITAEEGDRKTEEYVSDQMNLEDVLEGMVATYTDSFLTNPVMESFFNSFVPEDVMARLTEGMTEPTTEAPATEDLEEGVEPPVAPSASPPEVTTEELTPVDNRRVEARPSVRRRNDYSLWNRNYGGRYDPETGEPIIVEPRPPEGSTGPSTTNRRGPIDLVARWNRDYGDTHNPDGTPKEVESDQFVVGDN